MKHIFEDASNVTKLPMPKRLVSIILMGANELGQDCVFLFERIHRPDYYEAKKLDPSLTPETYAGERWYDLPGGEVNCGESPLAAAYREAKEELGIIVNDGAFIDLTIEDVYKISPNERFKDGIDKIFFGVRLGEFTGRIYDAESFDNSGHVSLGAYPTPEAMEKLGYRICPHLKASLLKSYYAVPIASNENIRTFNP